VIHVEGEVNPVRDLDIIFNELRLKDIEYLTKQMENLERTVLRGGDKKRKPEYVSRKSYFVSLICTAQPLPSVSSQYESTWLHLNFASLCS